MRPQRAAATIAFLFCLLGVAMLAAPFYEALATVRHFEELCASTPGCLP